MRLKREREFVSRAGTPSRQTAVPLWWRILTEWRVRRRSPPLCCWAAYMAVLQPRWCRIQLGKWTQPYRTGSLQWENTRIEKHQHQWFCCRTNRWPSCIDRWFHNVWVSNNPNVCKKLPKSNIAESLCCRMVKSPSCNSYVTNCGENPGVSNLWVLAGM